MEDVGVSATVAHRRSIVLDVSERVHYPAISVTNELAATAARLEGTEIIHVGARVSNPRQEQLTRTAVRLVGGGRVVNRLRRAEALEAAATTPADVLFMPVMPFRDLWVLAGLDLRAMAAARICFLDEIWAPDVHHFDLFRAILDQFDVVFVSNASAVAAVRAELRHADVRWLPAATDALVRCPQAAQRRAIDVLSVGRRCPVQHGELLAAAKERRLTYVFDTMRGGQTEDHADHRFNAAQLIKTSRMYIAHHAKFDSPEETGGADDFGGRYFDAQASGSIAIGEPPHTDEFRSYVADGSHVVAPAGRQGIVEQVDELLADGDRWQAMSTANVVAALRYNDWVHRWETMLAAVDRPLTESGVRRRDALTGLAAMIENGESPDAELARLATGEVAV